MAAALAATDPGGARRGRRHDVDEDLDRLQREHHHPLARPRSGRPPSSPGRSRPGPSTSDLNAVSFTTSPTQDVIGAAQSKVLTGMGADRLHPRALPGSRRRPAADLQRHPLDGHRRSAERHGDDAPQSRRHVGAALRDLGRELRCRRPGVLSGARPARRRLRHAGHRDLQRRRRPRPGSVGSEPAAGHSAAAAGTPGAGARHEGRCGLPGTRTRPATPASTCSSSPRRPAVRSGAPKKAPESESGYNNSFDMPLACSAACRVVYGRPGVRESRPRSCPGGPATRPYDRHVAADPAGRRTCADGRLPLRRPVLGRLVRGHGVPLHARRRARPRRHRARPGAPRSLAGAAFALSRSRSGTTSCWPPNYGWAAPNSRRWRRRQPRGPAAAGGDGARPARRRAHVTPGGKSFRIQVQYRVPVGLRDTRACAARARSVRVPARAATRRRGFPATGQLVLGTRGTVKLPRHEGPLLHDRLEGRRSCRAPFHTEGGYRVAETRLRVWLRTPRARC